MSSLRIGLGVAAGVAALAGGSWVGLRAGRAQRAEAPAPAVADVQAGPAELAEEMLGRLDRQPPLVGVLDFESELLIVGKDGTEEVRAEELGRLYVGPAGQVRLDLWPDGGRGDPIVCCVAQDGAWMIWGQSPLVYKSGLPLPRASSGWLGQLGHQAQQTLSWARLLLHFGLYPAAGKRVESALLTDERCLELRLAQPEAESRGMVTVEALPLPGSAVYYPHRVVYERHGSVVLFEELERLGETAAIAHVISSESTARRPTYSSWTVSQVALRSPDDPEFLASFQEPRGRDERYPELVGTCLYDAQGQEHITTWD